MRFILKRDAALSMATPVSNIFIMEYMPSAPESYVKVYLYGLMCTLCPPLNGDIASALSMEESTVNEALSYWRSRGLIEILDTLPPTVRYVSLHQGAPAPTRENAAFIGLLQGALSGRFLSQAELEKIFDWMDVFGMDESCAVMLVTYCAEIKGARVSVNYMDAVARSWADAGVLTADAAERYIAERRETAGGAQAVLKRWRLVRRPTEDELSLYAAWREMGFDDESILAACTEMTGAQQPSFKYLNSILETLRLKGAHDTAAIRELTKSRDAAAELMRLSFERAGIKRAPSARDTEQMQVWRDTWRIDSELILLAAELSADSSQPFAKMKKLLDDWHASGVRTVSEGKSAYAASQGGARKRPGTGYIQRKYTADELRGLGVKLLDDDEDQ